LAYVVHDLDTATDFVERALMLDTSALHPRADATTDVRIGSLVPNSDIRRASTFDDEAAN
jgi:hypothetical protein